MKVADWNKWTSAKKKAIVVLYCTGMLLGFTIEEASLWWGVLGIFLCLLGAGIVGTIRYDEW